MKKKEIKVEVIFTEGYKERFTQACIKVAKRREERKELQMPKKVPAAV